MSYLPYLPTTQEPSRFDKNVRPRRFRLNPKHPLANGLVFAGLGNGVGQKYWDYSGQQNHGTLTNMEPDSDWVWVPELGRWGLDFDGVEHRVPLAVLNSARVNNIKTIAIWLKQPSLRSAVVIGSSHSNYFLTSYGYAIYTANDGTVRAKAANNNAEWDTNLRATLQAGMNHVVCTFTNEGEGCVGKLYLNGVLAASHTGIAGHYSYQGSMGSGIAAGTPGYFFEGQLSDPLIHNRVLSPAEIQQLADPTNAMLSGLIEPEEPDRSISRKRVASYHVIGSGLHERPESFELDYSHPLMKGCVFAGLGGVTKSTKYLDSSSFKNHGTLTGMVPAEDWVWVPELGRWRIGRDGSNSWRSSHANAATLNNLAPVTWSAWVWMDSAAVDTKNTLFAKRNSYYGEGWVLEVQWQYTANSRLRLEVDGSTELVSQSPNDMLVVNRWHHISCTWTGGTSPTTSVAFFIDGVKTGYHATRTTGVSLTAESSVPLAIGNASAGTTGSGAAPFYGLVADPFIHKRILTPAEIQQLADPSNVLLSGAIKPPPRKYFRGVTLSDAYTLQYRVDHGHERPQAFELDYSHPLARNLLFAGLGRVTGSDVYWDSAINKRYKTAVHGSLSSAMVPGESWRRGIGRPTIRFNPDYSYLTTGIEANALPWPGSSFSATLSLFVKIASNPTTQRRIVQWVGGSTDYLRVYQKSNTLVAVYYANSERNEIPVTVGEWVHIALAWEPLPSRRMIAYVNGVPQSTVWTSPTTSYFENSALIFSHNASPTWKGELADVFLHQGMLPRYLITMLANKADPLLGGFIRPVARVHPRIINDRHWVGRTSDYHDASNWSRSRGGPGRAGVPNENHNLYLDATLPEYE